MPDNTPKQKFETARDLIRAGKFNEARRLLKTIDHPKAAEWLARIDQLDPLANVKPLKGDPAGTAFQQLRSSGWIYNLAILLVCVVLIGLVTSIITSSVQESSTEATEISLTITSTILPPELNDLLVEQFGGDEGSGVGGGSLFGGFSAEGLADIPGVTSVSRASASSGIEIGEYIVTLDVTVAPGSNNTAMAEALYSRSAAMLGSPMLQMSVTLRDESASTVYTRSSTGTEWSSRSLE